MINSRQNFLKNLNGQRSESHNTNAGLTIFFRDVLSLIRLGEAKWICTRAVLSGVFFALFESLGIATIYPLVLYLQEGGQAVLDKTEIFQYVGKIMGTFGVSINAAVIVGVLFIFVGLRTYCSYLRAIYSQIISLDFSANARNLIFNRLMLEKLEDSKSVKEDQRISILIQDCHRLGEFVRNCVEFFTSLCIACVFVIALMIVSVETTILMVIISIFTLLLYGKIGRVGKSIGIDISATSAKIHRRMVESMANYRLVKQRVMENDVSKRMNDDFFHLASLQIKILKRRALIDNTTYIVFVGYIVGGFLLLANNAGGDIALISTYALLSLRVVPHLGALNSSKFEITNTHPSLDVIARQWSDLGAAEDLSVGQDHWNGFDELSAEGLEYSYLLGHGKRSAVKVLNGIDVVLAKGFLVAIVGRSGAGKSTLVDILSGLLEQQNGRILLDGQNRRGQPLSSYRKSVGFVPQDPVFFDSSIRENLSFGAITAFSDHELSVALAEANCSSFINGLVDGLDTQMGSYGSRFSGGQRQRLAIARELLRKPSLMILDEPTSALDGEAEASLVQTLEALKKRCAVAVVAHRFKTVECADKIYVLETGRVVDEGVAEDLQHNSSLFRSLFNLND